MIGVRIATIQVLSETCCALCVLAFPGGKAGPTKSATSGVAIALSTIQATITRFAWFVRREGRCATVDIGLDDVQEAVHVADRLHRPAEAIEPARGARHEALPAVVALRARVERELDRPVRARQRARRVLARVLRVVGTGAIGTTRPYAATANVCEPGRAADSRIFPSTRMTLPSTP